MASFSEGVASLLRSRKFLTAVFDAVVSLVLFFAVKYLAPGAVEDVKVLIAAFQPIIALIIAAWAVEDIAVSFAIAREQGCCAPTAKKK
jgi:uncharacterized membrane protein